MFKAVQQCPQKTNPLVPRQKRYNRASRRIARLQLLSNLPLLLLFRERLPHIRVLHLCAGQSRWRFPWTTQGRRLSRLESAACKSKLSSQHCSRAAMPDVLVTFAPVAATSLAAASPNLASAWPTLVPPVRAGSARTDAMLQRKTATFTGATKHARNRFVALLQEQNVRGAPRAPNRPMARPLHRPRVASPWLQFAPRNNVSWLAHVSHVRFLSSLVSTAHCQSAECAVVWRRARTEQGKSSSERAAAIKLSSLPALPSLLAETVTTALLSAGGSRGATATRATRAVSTSDCWLISASSASLGLLLRSGLRCRATGDRVSHACPLPLSGSGSGCGNCCGSCSVSPALDPASFGGRGTS